MNPWWWPVPADDDDDGFAFSVTWDHLGDARQQYDALAKAFLDLVAKTGSKPEDFR
jgi:hypothetical protein